MADYVPQNGRKMEFIQKYPRPDGTPDEEIKVGRWVRINGEDDGTADSDWFVNRLVGGFAGLSRKGVVRAEHLTNLKLTGW